MAKKITIFYKKGVFSAFFCVLAVVFGGKNTAFGDESGWMKLDRGIEISLENVRVAVNDQKDQVFLCRGGRLYRISPGEDVWTEVHFPGVNRTVNDVAVHKGLLAVAVSKGVYIEDGKGGWELLPFESDIKRIWVVDDSIIIVADDGQIYKGINGSWTKIIVPGTDSRMDNCFVTGSRMFGALKDDIYTSCDGGNSWSKYKLGGDLSADEGDLCDDGENSEDDIKDECPERIFPYVRDFWDNESQVDILTARGVYMIDDEGKAVMKADTFGLPADEAEHIICSYGNIFVSTNSKVYLRSDDRWVTVFGVSSNAAVIQLLLCNKNNERYIFVVTEKEIFMKKITNIVNENGIEIGYGKHMSMAAGEPGILEVQKMAIKYAEVDPSKIEKWRKDAKVRAIMPKVSVGFDHSTNDNIEVYTSASTSYSVCGPQENGDDWHIDLSWDLSELIWADAQTSIDARSRLMVELRNDILEEVTRIYFERKRLLHELAVLKDAGRDAFEKELRIDELTAHLDLLTGGGFSRSVEH
ncbi:MAG TPA: hypothetical protein PKY78_09240 [Candidatus Omnitrophota bacterium]|nr:hypothetical protein [Candidatus Omnitrophota bacterium]HPS21151.1 hypothetical protein [Candidatus Omnitrophota bacterium]